MAAKLGFVTATDGPMDGPMDAGISHRHLLSHLHATTTILTTLASHANHLLHLTSHHQQYLIHLNNRLASLEQELGIASDQKPSLPEAAEVSSIDVDSLLQPLADLGRELEAGEEAGEGGSAPESESPSAEDSPQGNPSAEAAAGDNDVAVADNVTTTNSGQTPATPAKPSQQKPTIPADLTDRVAAAIDSLEIVRDSIENGKPDKRALPEWVDEQRALKPTLSYTAMASVLDQAGIPTLSGRQGWHRGSVRNLVAKNGG